MMVEGKTEPKEDANKWLVVVGLIITGLLIGGGLVFAGYKLTQQKVPEFAPEPTPIVEEASPSPSLIEEATPPAVPSEPTPTPTTSPTADWETYTNTVYGYQFRHPAGWVFTARAVATDPSKPLYVIRQEVQSNDIDDYLVSVRAWENPDERSLADWLQFMKDSNALPLPSEEMDTTANTQVGGPASPDASQGGEDALQFWSDPISGGAEPGECVQACPVLSVYFVHGDKAYVAELNYLREFDEDSFVLFSQVLSTFEFL